MAMSPVTYRPPQPTKSRASKSRPASASAAADEPGISDCLASAAKSANEKAAAISARKAAKRAQQHAIARQEHDLLATKAEAIYLGRIGRPTTYTEEKGRDICAWIASGHSLTKWCERTGTAMQVVYEWLKRQPAFSEDYAHAQEIRADSLADAVIDIIDEQFDNPNLTNEQVQLLRLRMEGRKWIASKLKPRAWGDHAPASKGSGTIQIHIGIPPAPAPLVVVTEIDDRNTESH